MALLEIVLEGQLFGQQTINRFNYLSSGTPAASSLSFALYAAFGCFADGTPPAYPADAPFAKMRVVQSVALSYVEVVVKNIYDLADFYASPFPALVDGDVESSTCLSPTTAFGLETNQTTRAVRRGQKRIPGVPEGSVGNGGVIDAGVTEELEELCSFLSDSLTYDDEGNTLTFTPCIVSKQSYTTPSGRTAYKYYPTLAEQTAHLAQGVAWVPFAQTRTQRSRQYGKGS